MIYITKRIISWLIQAGAVFLLALALKWVPMARQLWNAPAPINYHPTGNYINGVFYPYKSK